MKVLVFIDHDIICRHFTMNGALAELVRRAEVQFVFPDDQGKRLKVRVEDLPLATPFVRLPINARRQQTWRWLLYAEQLKLRPGAHEAAIRRIRRLTLGWKASTLLFLAGLPVGSAVFERIVNSRLKQDSNRALVDLLDREQPDVVLHPSVLDGVFINDLVAECGKRNVPLVVAINSWDNPSTKRAVVGQPDWLLVWGEQTREHAIRFMDMPAEKVVAFGAAQFDVFSERTRVNRGQFCTEHGIDPSRRVVLFAGSNARTDEVATLDALDAEIEAGQMGPVTILYRPHPWGGGGKDGARLASRSWRHIVVDCAMRDYLNQLAAGDRSMSLPDYRHTHDLLSAVDAVVSPLSTILVEAALHGKPVAAYLPESGSETLDMMIPLLHFEEFFALDDVLVVNSFESLVKAIPVLTAPTESVARGERLKAAAARFVTPFPRPWRERIADFVTDLGRSRQDSRRFAAE